jgi:hypothetical protein
MTRTVGEWVRVGGWVRKTALAKRREGTMMSRPRVRSKGWWWCRGNLVHPGLGRGWRKRYCRGKGRERKGTDRFGEIDEGTSATAPQLLYDYLGTAPDDGDGDRQRRQAATSKGEETGDW